MNNPGLVECMSRNYGYELIRDSEQGGYFATHPDLDGCAAQGETAQEAIDNLDDARELWIETRLEDGLRVPEPQPEEPSGRISLRMPSSLHAQLIKRAGRQGVSLNLLLNTVLAEYVGHGNSRPELDFAVGALRAVVAELEARASASSTSYPIGSQEQAWVGVAEPPASQPE